MYTSNNKPLLTLGIICATCGVLLFSDLAHHKAQECRGAQPCGIELQHAPTPEPSGPLGALKLRITEVTTSTGIYRMGGDST